MGKKKAGGKGPPGGHLLAGLRCDGPSGGAGLSLVSSSENSKKDRIEAGFLIPLVTNHQDYKWGFGQDKGPVRALLGTVLPAWSLRRNHSHQDPSQEGIPGVGSHAIAGRN